jgi:RNA polymerase sigma factor (sigma-70 family)
VKNGTVWVIVIARERELYVDIKHCSDEELVQKMFPRPGQDAWEVEMAWSEFISRFEQILIKVIKITYRRFAPHIQLKKEDTRDLVQQIFLKLSEKNYRALRELQCHQENSVKLYLHTIAANTALDCVRAAQVARRSSISYSLSEDEYAEEHNISQAEKIQTSEANPEEQVLQKELLDLVMAVVEGESDEKTRARNRLIFLLAHRDGYTRREIADRKDIQLKRTGVNSLLNRIKKRLEELCLFPINSDF